MKKEIFCTLGPNSLNKKFLLAANKLKVNLLRINMSHVEIKKLLSLIKFIRRFSKIPICIDTEGAQIRTKVKKALKLKANKIIHIFRKQENFCLYPPEIYDQLKQGDILDIGFTGLVVRILKKNKLNLAAKVLKSGLLETNKGVHLKNRKIKINFLTKKDFKAIEIGKKYGIKNYALSFTNTKQDVINFNRLLNNEKKFFKIETKTALKNLKSILYLGQNFLIDRGDLSKDISFEYIPVAQRQILKVSNKLKKKVYVATNFLETMIINSSPTRGEVNDIFNTLELGAKGLVLAAETAIGNHPIECIRVLKKIINIFSKNKSII